MDSMGQGAASPGDTSAENSPALSDPHVSAMDIMGQGAAGDTSAVNSSASSDVSGTYFSIHVILDLINLSYSVGFKFNTLFPYSEYNLESIPHWID